jgi:hypothetical protein
MKEVIGGLLAVALLKALGVTSAVIFISWVAFCFVRVAWNNYGANPGE